MNDRSFRCQDQQGVALILGLFFAIIVWLLASSGSFIQNLRISAASRLITYGLVCAAVPVLRRRDGTPGGPEPAAFRLPAGNAIAAVGIAFMALTIF